jgi:hypothetical protein
MIQPPKSYLGLSFPQRRLKITNGEALGPSPVCGRERNEVRNKLGERGSRVSFEDRSNRSDQYEKLV